jgi:hypothetical protein
LFGIVKDALVLAGHLRNPRFKKIDHHVINTGAHDAFDFCPPQPARTNLTSPCWTARNKLLHKRLHGAGEIAQSNAERRTSGGGVTSNECDTLHSWGLADQATESTSAPARSLMTVC